MGEGGSGAPRSAWPERPSEVDARDWASLIQAVEKSTPQAKLTAADGAAGDNLGIAVAVSGDTAVIGAANDRVGSNSFQGSAYVFVRSGSTWTQQAQLVAADGASTDFFGSEVAVSGDTALVSAFRDDVGANSDQGSAYVFVRSGSTWTQQAKLLAQDGAADSWFGYSLALSGDTAVVGASDDDVGGRINQGSAYVFVRSGTSWSQQAKLTAADGAEGDSLGRAVALSGDTVLVGASGDDVGGLANRGSAYVFTRAGASWTQQAKLLAADGAANDFFGDAVALSRETALVGAWRDDVGANPDQGSAYVFVRSGVTWSQQARLLAAEAAAGDGFGFSVALSGDVAAVGAMFDDLGSSAEQGSAHVFVRSGAAWALQARVLAADGAASDQFGAAVAISADTLVVGAVFDAIGANAGQGSAHVFLLPPASWQARSKLLAPEGGAGDQFGFSVALQGDTAVIGARAATIGDGVGQGAAYVFARRGGFWQFEARLLAADAAAEDVFGTAVALSGDTVLVGAYGRDIGANADQGAAYVFVRSGGAWTQQARLQAADGGARDYFGSAVALSGDTALVGADGDDIGANANQGAAYVFVRSDGSWTQQTKLLAADGAADDGFGFAVALSGDTALIAAPADYVGAIADQGTVHAFVRGGTAWTLQQRLQAADGASYARFGSALALLSDTALIGAIGARVGSESYAGAAYVWERSGSSWMQRVRLTSLSPAAQDYFGSSVALSTEGALIGAYSDDIGPAFNQGSAQLFLRDDLAWRPQARLQALDGTAQDEFGIAVALDGGTALVGAWRRVEGSRVD